MRRRTAIALALICMLACGAQAATLCVNAPGVVVLADDRGAEKTENGRFESAFVVREGALYAAGRKGAYSLFDAQGQPLGDAQFSMIEDVGHALLFSSDHLYGAMSPDGEILLEPRWTQLTPDGSGGWLALAGDPLDEHADEIIHIDGTGTEKKTGVYCTDGLSPVSDGRMPFMNADGRYGALDAGGAVAVSPVWQYMGAYSNGLAKVAGPEGMGLIDISGRTVIAPTLQWLERSAAMIAAWDGTNLDVYGPRGGQRRARLSGKIQEIALAGDDLVVTYEGRTCLYDVNGRLLAQDGGGVSYTEGTRGQLIASNGQWGEKCQWLVNPDGSKASGLFQQLLPLCAERYAFLEMPGEAYESQALGRTQTAWNYGECRYGLMDGRGRIITSAKYREIRAVSGDRLLLIGDDRVQLADRNGVVMKTWIMPEGAEANREAAE
ncbi:MAG: WG repeat-containing protein [Clostridia bacterium]|nr:WG repeat-containing protein [Clostridia bacterium]